MLYVRWMIYIRRNSSVQISYGVKSELLLILVCLLLSLSNNPIPDRKEVKLEYQIANKTL